MIAERQPVFCATATRVTTCRLYGTPSRVVPDGTVRIRA
ncbi:hypothetical protein YT1_4748 [Rhodococcus ruber]|nr:hypothetical protein YT1_4748 [Rhodococcus ruber]